VSRFHARIAWDPEVGLPVVYDCGSQNGTKVNGETIRTAKALKPGSSRVVIGPKELEVTVLAQESAPALLPETQDLVALFSDSGDVLRGQLSEPEVGGTRRLLERLESDRRSGTLRISRAEGDVTVVYCLGRIMSADMPGYGSRTRALEQVLRLQQGRFEFGPDLEPLENPMNLWLSDYLGSRGEGGATTAWNLYK
jgi:FHA domain-containing protein